MTTNTTATAMSASFLVNTPTGLITKATDYTYTGAAVTASAHALSTQMLKVPHGATVTGFVYRGSSGAATCPVDIGIEVTSGATSVSQFASAVTIGSAFVGSALNGKVPFTVSCPDSQATQYGKVYCFATPGTATSAIQMALQVIYTYQGNT